LLPQVDLFYLFRWLLAMVGTVYTLVCTGQSLYRWLAYFQSSRQTAMLGRYTLVLLLRTRGRRFVSDLCQIGFLVAAFIGLIYIHRL
jgi:hypothetical protein